jgi:hypothetical protein
LPIGLNCGLRGADCVPCPLALKKNRDAFAAASAGEDLPVPGVPALE